MELHSELEQAIIIFAACTEHNNQKYDYYYEFKKYLLYKNYTNSTVRKILSLTHKFFEYCEKQEVNIQMNTKKIAENSDMNTQRQESSAIEVSSEQDITQTMANENNEQPSSFWSSESESVPEVPDIAGDKQTPKKKAGAKTKAATGEKRTEKIMLYLTKSLYEDFKDLAGFYGKSLTDYAISLLQDDIERKREKIDALRHLRED